MRKGSVDDVLGVCLGGGTILEDEEEAEEEVKGDCWVEDPVEVKRESILCSSGVCIVVVTDDVLVWWVVCVLVCVLSKKREKKRQEQAERRNQFYVPVRKVGERKPESMTLAQEKKNPLAIMVVGAAVGGD